MTEQHQWNCFCGLTPTHWQIRQLLVAQVETFDIPKVQKQSLGFMHRLYRDK